jgi:MYXO-CTERM domain-containing protein
MYADAMRRWSSWLFVASCLLSSARADAFCGFYAGSGGAKLFNNATQVVLMREGTRTVLSMANNYQGPPENFAMVVPVPVILQKENVKTLAPGIFERIDQLTAPRLVEYWEQNPCPEQGLGFGAGAMPPRMAAGKAAGGMMRQDEGLPLVKVEAQFSVGEYEIVILSAQDSMALEAWLRQEKYSIPDDAAPVLRPYVQAGMKFFVARINIDKVRKEGEQTMLSPLRFHYDSELFSLPIRLGLLNSGGTQDLIVNILSSEGRYEVANYKNVAIPTNLNVKNTVKNDFGPFYAALFDQTLKKHPGAVVTEYAWDAGSCDPCPTPPLSPKDLAALGADLNVASNPAPSAAPPARRGRRQSGVVLTRLHARYTRETLGEDLVFRQASPIAGGREVMREEQGLEQGAQPSSLNNFQARYAIRYPWMGAITCKNPQRGVWGGPPNEDMDQPPPRPAARLAFEPRKNIDPWPLIKTNQPVAATLLGSAEKVATTFPVGLLAAPPPPSASAVLPPEPAPSAPSPSMSSEPAPPPVAAPPRGGCAGCQTSPAGSAWSALLALGGAALLRLRRKNR